MQFCRSLLCFQNGQLLLKSSPYYQRNLIIFCSRIHPFLWQESASILTEAAYSVSKVTMEWMQLSVVVQNTDLFYTSVIKNETDGQTDRISANIKLDSREDAQEFDNPASINVGWIWTWYFTCRILHLARACIHLNGGNTVYMSNLFCSVYWNQHENP